MMHEYMLTKMNNKIEEFCYTDYGTNKCYREMVVRYCTYSSGTDAQLHSCSTAYNYCTRMYTQQNRLYTCYLCCVFYKLYDIDMSINCTQCLVVCNHRVVLCQ